MGLMATNIRYVTGKTVYIDVSVSKRLSVTQLDNGKYKVELYDEAGELIAWCGPYNVEDRDTCINLFRPQGWMKYKGLDNTDGQP
jgi:hypothetical protein